jgi:hypothetical protein
MKKKFNFHIGIILISIFMVWSCDNPINNSSTSDNDLITLAKRGHGKAPGASIETVGNNLSFPVIWSDGVALDLRGVYGEPSFEGQSFLADGYDWYVQNDPNNTWQAESKTVEPSDGDIVVSYIDWGDNLEAKSWPLGGQIRVEVVLYKTLTTPMTAYKMQIEDPNQTGVSEVWGTNTETYPSDSATVYSGTARLVIQKLGKDRDDPNLSVTWDPVHSRWIGDDIGDPLFNGGVWQNIDGPGGYSAEVNVQGKVIYGYNWVTRTTADGEGDYRITFVLDPNSSETGITCNTAFGEYGDEGKVTEILPGEEEGGIIVQALAEEPDDLGGGIAKIDLNHNLTYIDVRLTSGKGSGRKGGGGNNSGGHGHHGGGD